MFLPKKGTGSSTRLAMEINHANTGHVSAWPAAAHINGTLKGDHRCLLTAPGKTLPWSTAPTLVANDLSKLAATRTSVAKSVS